MKVALNTNKTDHHILRYTWHIVESVRYNVEYGDQFYWCLTPLSSMLVIV